jgi:aconitase A
VHVKPTRRRVRRRGAHRHPGEADYYRHGGILQYVLRKMIEG